MNINGAGLRSGPGPELGLGLCRMPVPEAWARASAWGLGRCLGGVPGGGLWGFRGGTQAGRMCHWGGRTWVARMGGDLRLCAAVTRIELC